MGRMRVGTRWLGIALLWLAGCQTSQPTVRPRVHPEEFNLPPTEDARFSTPINYPKEVLNKDSIKKGISTGGPGGPGGSLRSQPGGRPGGPSMNNF